MTRPIQLLIAVAIAVLSAGAGLWYYQWQSARGPSSAAIGELLFASTFPGLDSAPQPLAAWRGKLLVVNFWATWCEPCREEIPAFIAIQREYAARHVQFVGIAIDERDRVEPYARTLGINYPTLIGSIEAFEFLRKLGNRRAALPYTIVLGADGTVANSTLGILSPAKLRSVLDDVLAQQPEPK